MKNILKVGGKISKIKQKIKHNNKSIKVNKLMKKNKLKHQKIKIIFH